MPHSTPEARAAYHQAYRAKHRERLTEMSRIYREKNYDVLKEKKRDEYVRHREDYLARSKKNWHSLPYWKQKFQHGMFKAKASKCEIVSKESIAEYYKEVFSSIDQVCTYCHGRFAISDITIDHKTPKARGGKHEVSNFLVACVGCNIKKHLTPYSEWVAQRD